ncbi:protease inhibitors-like [Schistocerca gregaria]|uniref:protease inhibitors-like n=1 Tax=Schistocerca gregaria TaxID=7010 RepID=UPI00211EE261|nr:protease inhibitors-like [Schistocerca gregaria]
MRFIVVVFALVLLAVGTTAQNEKECTPGETKKEDCNSCFCSDAGIWGCTRMACLSWQTASTPSDTATRVRRSERQCTPNTTFKKDCNTCYCNSDGTAALCTAKGCLSRSTREVSCTPGTTYKEGCNTCRCLADGKSGVCTRRACLPDGN